MTTAIEIDRRWTIGGKPNGGYLLSLMARDAVAAVPHEHVLSASTVYLHSPDPGPASITVEVLRQGRSASHARATLVQDGRACVEALVLIGTLDPVAEPFYDGGVPVPSAVPRDECIRLEPHPEFPVALLDLVDIRLDPATAGFTRGEPSGRAELHGWLALPDGEPFDTAWLLFAVDALPPATFELERSGWVPTLELTAYVRALPAPGPVRVLQQARLIEDQRVDEACFVWDSRGRLVAQATQLAAIRMG